MKVMERIYELKRSVLSELLMKYPVHLHYVSAHIIGKAFIMCKSFSISIWPNPCLLFIPRQKRMMGMTPNEAELNDVESHYPTDRIPMEMKEKSVAENLLDRMSETQ